MSKQIKVKGYKRSAPKSAGKVKVKSHTRSLPSTDMEFSKKDVDMYSAESVRSRTPKGWERRDLFNDRFMSWKHKSRPDTIIMKAYERYAKSPLVIVRESGEWKYDRNYPTRESAIHACLKYMEEHP